MPITLHKNITWQLVEDKPVLISRIYADHPDHQRAQHWPDPSALTRAQAVDLVRAIQDMLDECRKSRLQPAGGALEGILAIAGAALALWSTHLHRAVSALRNQSQVGSPGTPPQTPPT